MGNPRSAPPIQGASELKTAYQQLMDEYKAHQALIDQDNLYSRLFVGVEEKYAAFETAHKTIPTDDDIARDFKIASEYHEQETKRHEEIIANIDKDSTGEIAKYSVLLANLKSPKKTIDDKTAQIEDKKEQIAALTEANKNAGVIDQVRNRASIASLELDIGKLEREKITAMNQLCTIINQSGGEAPNAKPVDATTAYDVANRLIRLGDNAVNRLMTERQASVGWLSREQERYESEIKLINGKKKEALKSVGNLFDETNQQVRLLSEKMAALREREQLIKTMQERLDVLAQYSIPNGSPASRAFESAKQALKLMKEDNLSNITGIHTYTSPNGEKKQFPGTNQIYEDKINGFIKTANDSIKSSLESGLTSWDKRRNEGGEKFANLDMPGTTRSQVRTMFHVMNSLANGDNEIKVNLGEITGDKKIITLNLTDPDFTTAASAFFQEARLTEAQTKIMLDVINNHSAINQKEIKNLIRSGDFLSASVRLHQAGEFLTGFESQMSTIIQEAVRTPEYKEEVKIHEEKMNALRNDVQEMSARVQRENIKKMFEEMNNKADSNATTIRELINSNDLAAASSLIRSTEESLRDFEHQILDRISQADLAPDFKEQLDSLKGKIEKVEELRTEVRQKINGADEEDNERLRRQAAEVEAHITELDKKTLQFLELLVKNHPELTNKIKIEKDNPSFLTDVRSALLSKKSIWLLQHGQQQLGIFGLGMEKLVLPDVLLKDEILLKEPKEKVAIKLTKQEKALAGVIFTPEQFKSSREQIFNDITAKQENTQSPSTTRHHRGS